MVSLIDPLFTLGFYLIIIFVNLGAIDLLPLISLFSYLVLPILVFNFPFILLLQIIAYFYSDSKFDIIGAFVIIFSIDGLFLIGYWFFLLLGFNYSMIVPLVMQYALNFIAKIFFSLSATVCLILSSYFDNYPKQEWT